MKHSLFILYSLLIFAIIFSPCSSVDPKVRSRLLRIARKTSLVQSNKKLFNRAAGLLKRIENGCTPNICFALDGSGSIGGANFELQKEFVLLLTALIGAHNNATFSAVQYGLINNQISNIDQNPSRFIENLVQAQYQDAKLTFVGAGIAYCISQLERKRGEANKIVLFGDGTSSLGDTEGPLGPKALAEYFRKRSPGNAVCAVAIGSEQMPDTLLDITGGKPSLVLTVPAWGKVLNVLRTLLRDICEASPQF